MEPNSNINYVCKECSKERRKKFQETFTENDYRRIQSLIKDGEVIFLKVIFSEEQMILHKDDLDLEYHIKGNMYEEGTDSKTELMWAKCVSINLKDRAVIGILNNEPVELSSLKYGDVVVFSFDHILDIIYPEKCLN